VVEWQLLELGVPEGLDHGRDSVGVHSIATNPAQS